MWNRHSSGLDLGVANWKKLAKNVFIHSSFFGRVVWASSIVRLSTSVDKWNRTKDALKKTPQTFDLGDATWLRVQLGCA